MDSYAGATETYEGAANRLSPTYKDVVALLNLVANGTMDPVVFCELLSISHRFDLLETFKTLGYNNERSMEHV